MLYQVMLGCTGNCLNVLGNARMCKDVLGYGRLYQDLLGYTGICLDVLGYARMCKDVLSSITLNSPKPDGSHFST